MHHRLDRDVKRVRRARFGRGRKIGGGGTAGLVVCVFVCVCACVCECVCACVCEWVCKEVLLD